MELKENWNEVEQNNEKNITNQIKNEINEKFVKFKFPNGTIKIKKYNIGKLLGECVNGKYYEFIIDENNKKKTYACKLIPKQKKFKSNDDNYEDVKINEIDIHKILNHSNMVPFKGYFEEEDNICMITELYNNSLEQLIQHRKKITELEVQYYIFQIVNALKYLHKQKIIHRNLQLSNLFLSDKLILKIGDLSLATKLMNEDINEFIYGNANYVAPEIIDDEKGYSYQVDTWSLGVIIYTLIIGRYPFESKDEEEIFKKIKNIDYLFPDDSIISEDAKDLIKEILVKDPLKRPSLDGILSHYFFKQSIKIPFFLSNSFLDNSPSLSFIKEYMPDVTKDLIVKKSFKNVNNVKIYIKKWIDNSQNNGFGYLLNNGYYGAVFNNNSVIILNQNSNYFYYSDNIIKEEILLYNKYELNNYPNNLKNKFDFIEMIKKYLKWGNGKESFDIENNNNNNIQSLLDLKTIVFVKSYILLPQNTIMFRFSNKDIQAFFKDDTEIIISEESRIVIYVKRNGDRYAFPYSTANGINFEGMTERLYFVKNN